MSDLVFTCRQNWSKECENALNTQINTELDASYQYMSLYSYFSRETVALENIANYFKKASEEEREHALKFIDYQNKRGGKVRLKDIKGYTYEPKSDSNKSDVLKAFEMVLLLEKKVNQDLLNLHRTADSKNDAQFSDYLESEFLNEQVDAIYEISKYINQLNRIGNDGHGIWEFNNKLK